MANSVTIKTRDSKGNNTTGVIYQTSDQSASQWAQYVAGLQARGLVVGTAGAAPVNAAAASAAPTGTATSATVSRADAATTAGQQALKAAGYSDYQILQYMNGETMAPPASAGTGAIQKPTQTQQSTQQNIPTYANATDAAAKERTTGSYAEGQLTPAKAATATNPTTVTPTGGVTNTAGNAANLQAALDLINNSDLDATSKQLFSQLVQNWPADKIPDAANIIKQFDTLKNNTIDPYYQEQANIFIDQIKRAQTSANQANAITNEQVAATEKSNIENSKANLEASGLTFSGQGVKQLGTESAYAPQNTQGVAPALTVPFGGVPEGTVQQTNRLLSTSTQQQQQQQLQDLQRQAEQTLGTQGTHNAGIGSDLLGGVTGTLPFQKTQAEYGALQSTQNAYQTAATQALPQNVLT